jgi:hypothetical protein
MRCGLNRTHRVASAASSSAAGLDGVFIGDAAREEVSAADFEDGADEALKGGQ